MSDADNARARLLAFASVAREARGITTQTQATARVWRPERGYRKNSRWWAMASAAGSVSIVVAAARAERSSADADMNIAWAEGATPDEAVDCAIKAWREAFRAEADRIRDQAEGWAHMAEVAEARARRVEGVRG